MKLIVGLGNPGKEYENTRHNMGYLTVDKFAEMCRVDFDKSKFNGVFVIVKNDTFNEDFIIAKPETFMNLSGEFVKPLMEYFKIDVEDLLVVYDDMAIKEGEIKLKPDGSSGAHKGIQNIIDHLHTTSIKRIKVGIGEPLGGAIDFVLGKPKGESMIKIEEATDKAAKAIRDYLLKGFDYAMNIYNTKEAK